MEGDVGTDRDGFGPGVGAGKLINEEASARMGGILRQGKARGARGGLTQANNSEKE